jgi:hypothetical protein
MREPGNVLIEEKSTAPTLLPMTDFLLPFRLLHDQLSLPGIATTMIKRRVAGEGKTL